jgi:hypothetical protein
MLVEGAEAHHGGDVCVLVVAVFLYLNCSDSSIEELQGRSFLFRPNPNRGKGVNSLTAMVSYLRPLFSGFVKKLISSPIFVGSKI